MPKDSLTVTEELDFAYLLELMRPLHNVDEYAWLPELFSLIGHESFIDLCRYAGGELIRIPTLDELCKSIESLQLFYDINIKHIKTESDIPDDYRSLYDEIKDIYNVRDC